MVKKVSAVVALLLLLCCLLCSCEEPVESTEKTLDDGQTSERFFVLCDEGERYGNAAMVIVDTETRVQYLVMYGMYRVDVQMLVDAEGNPLLYTGEIFD